MIYKNISSQGIYVYAYDTNADAAKTGDAANITATISKDGGAENATNDVNPTEIGHGVYWFDLSQPETNCGSFVIAAVSGTADISLDPVVVNTTEFTPTKIGYVNSNIAALKTVADTIAADVVNIDGDAMHGTDNANTTVPDAAGIAAALHTTTDALIATLNNLSAATVNAQCDTAISDAALATAAALATHDGKLDTVDSLVDTLIARLTAARAGYLDNLSVGAVALEASISVLNDLSAAQVNTEVDDVLNVDSKAEATSTPTKTASLGDKLNWLFSGKKTKLTQSTTKQIIYKDDGTELSQAAVSEVGDVLTIGKFEDYTP